METAFSGQPTDFVEPHSHGMPCIWENVHMVHTKYGDHAVLYVKAFGKPFIWSL